MASDTDARIRSKSIDVKVLGALIASWYVCSLLTDLLNKEVGPLVKVKRTDSFRFKTAGAYQAFLLQSNSSLGGSVALSTYEVCGSRSLSKYLGRRCA